MSERAYLKRLSSVSTAIPTVTDEVDDRTLHSWGQSQSAKSRWAALEILRVLSSIVAIGFALETFHVAVAASVSTLLAFVGWWSLRASLAFLDRRAVVIELPDVIMGTIPYLQSGYRPNHAWNLALSRKGGCGGHLLGTVLQDRKPSEEQSHLIAAFRITLELLAESRGTTEPILTAFADEVRQTGRLLDIAGERLATSVRVLWMTTMLTGVGVGIALRHLPAADETAGFIAFVAGLAAVSLASLVVAGEVAATLFRRRLWRD